MREVLSRTLQRGAASLSALALAAGLVIAVPQQAQASNIVAGAVAAAILGISLKGSAPRPAPKPAYTVMARYCLNKHTGLYHKC